MCVRRTYMPIRSGEEETDRLALWHRYRGGKSSADLHPEENLYSHKRDFAGEGSKI